MNHRVFHAQIKFRVVCKAKNPRGELNMEIILVVDDHPRTRQGVDDLQKAFFSFVFGAGLGNRIHGVFFVLRLGGNTIWRIGTGRELSKVCRRVARATGNGQNLGQTEI